LFEPGITKADIGVWLAAPAPALFLTAGRDRVRLRQRGRYL
jgi:hypothetical protein